MTHGYAQYEQIKGLLIKYNIVLPGRSYDRYIKDLVRILRI
jgi:hypothetical protein